VLRNERTDWPTVGFNSNNEVSISKPYFSGVLILKDSLLTVSGINKVREENNLIFYNQFFGDYTGTSNTGFEAIVNPINAWLANDTVYCVVDSISPVGQNTIIPDGSMVVSASGTIANYMSLNICINDTIKILLNILPSVSMLKEMMGGHPIVIRDGFSVSMDPNNSFIYTRHPRTAVGINKDTTKLFLVTVDGRQASSLGMNLYELADLMLQIGVYQGINLDGGGSTTMVIRNEVVNSPSDASGERPVSNALLVVSKAPLDTLTSLDVTPEFSKVFSFKLFQNYPNPFNPTTKIGYALPLLRGDERGVLVTLKVFDILGREVATLVNEEKPAGSYEVEFDGSNLPSGVYFHQLKVYLAEGGTGDFMNTKKMILLR